MAPRWVDDTIWWQLYPLGFTGAPIRTQHDVKNRFPHLEAWLDYAIELGASGLILGPIFASSTHGYDTLDLTQIDPRLGQLEDYSAFIQECHSRGLRVVLDGVFNHVGSDHKWVKSVRSQGPDSPYAELLSFQKTGGEIKFGNFEGHGALVELNHESTRVQDLVTEVLCKWLELGADGWRLDAAYAVPPQFWASVLPRVRRSFPDSWFVGEVIHGDYATIAEESTMDSLTQYELWKALWSSLQDENYYELAAAMERHNRFLQAELPLTFVGNHDVTRISSQVGESAAILALTALMTLGGTPAIYYGDELGYRGIKEERLGGDDDVRPLMPKSPKLLGPLGQHILDLHRQLIGVRRRHPWLVRSQSEVVEINNQKIVYRANSSTGPEYLTVSLVVGDECAASIATPEGTTIFEFRGPGGSV